MTILLVFAFVSGLVTIAAPCIWPLLPVILAATAGGGKRKPLGIVLGICISFAVLTLTISYVVKVVPLDPNGLRLVAAIVIAILGMVLVVPQLGAILEVAVGRLSGSLGNWSHGGSQGFEGGLVTGLVLGIVWSPCAGPILAAVATLTALRLVNTEVTAMMVAYVAGIGAPLLIFASGGRKVLGRFNTGRVQQIFGVVMILTAVAIYTNYDKVIQVKLLDFFPQYANFLYKFETQPAVKKELDRLKQMQLPHLGGAPEITGITTWLNTGGKALTLADLRGKVVLVDFWTYTCINCIRTLPHVTAWYEKYKDQGLVVIGVHTPEFEFEKETANVEAAIKRYKITYPVAQDNNYATWNAFSNEYWPAEYLIDRDGNIRRTHFGEGEYIETEEAIKQLLSETGKAIDVGNIELPDETPQGRLTPETYLGSTRGGDSWVKFEGKWEIGQKEAVVGEGASLTLDFMAGKVFLVARSATSADKIRIFIDGKEQESLVIDEAKLYTTVNLPKVGEHKLKLEFETSGTRVYAFTFGS